MYRNYEEYERFIEESKEKFPSAAGKIKKKSYEEFLRENYRDKIEFYLMAEWSVGPFHEIFYGEIDLESQEMTDEEIRADQIHNGVHDIIDQCYLNGESVNNAAVLVLDFLKNEGAVKNNF